jgi:uncharacterized membrane protein
VDLKKVVLLLSVLCVLLAVVSGVLGLMLYSQRRFVTTTSTNPYIMFDTKTAQACWAGPTSAEVVAGDPIDNALLKQNMAKIPFCSDLK